MLHALITQREGQNMYGKSTDVLEAAYTEFYESMGIRLHPVSNFTRDFEALFEDPIDVLIVTGGGTLHPKYYVEPHKAELQPHRDVMEERLIMYCVENEIPIIGVCRGMQHLNALLVERFHILHRLWYQDREVLTIWQKYVIRIDI